MAFLFMESDNDVKGIYVERVVKNNRAQSNV